MFVGFIALVIAVWGLIRQRLAWTRVIATRRDAVVLLLAALGVVIVGGLLSPSPSPSTTSTAAEASAPTPSVSSDPSVVPPAATASVPSPSDAAVVAAAPAQISSAPPQTGTPAVPEEVAAAPVPDQSSAPAVTVPRQRTATAPPAPVYTAPSTADTYTNVDGQQVERPDANTSGATAKCRDGSYSHSQHHSGTCSGHGGVSQWL